MPSMRDRAKIALKNAEIRKRKAILNSRILELEPLAKKGKVNKETVATRRLRTEELQDRVTAIPDGGVNNARKKVRSSCTARPRLLVLARNTASSITRIIAGHVRAAPTGSQQTSSLPSTPVTAAPRMQPGAANARGKLGVAKQSEVRIELGDMGGSNGDAAYYQDTEENVAFRSEFEDRKRKQDVVLDEIEAGVGRMGDIATDMGQELNKQDKLMDEVETNVRISQTATSRSARGCDASLQHALRSRPRCVCMLQQLQHRATLSGAVAPCVGMAVCGRMR